MNIDKLTPYIATGLACSALTAGICYLCIGKSTGGENYIIKECREIIAEKGNPDFDDKSAEIGMINGYLNSGGDEYTYYFELFNADEVQEVTDYVNSAGTALASGFQIGISEDGNILLTEVTEGFTADKQGLKTGDIITHIDGMSISEQGYGNYANKILGKQDTEVNLTVNRDGNVFDMTFRRDNELFHEVEWEMLGDTAYITISHFSMFSAGNMSSAMEEVGDADKFIIDLRNNGGGQNEYMIQAVDYFVDAGENVMHSYDGTEDVYSTTDGAVDAPIVVLVNEKTASAAEIFASMCKQFGRNVTLVGTNTFGKGIFQQEEFLSNGGKLHYTAGYFTVGDWDCWHGIGIAPDITVEMDSSLIGTDDDIQLKKAVELLEKY
ncbi:MAG: PDZ domain-containing protein [Ruminococcus sp.]|nr:PDZ domain-containing protein [Ruminococcus sp.]